MHMRLLAFSSVFVLLACGGPPASTCSAELCAGGCCDADGICQAGTAEAACGIGGVACNLCSGGQVCTASQACEFVSGAGGGGAAGGQGGSGGGEAGGGEAGGQGGGSAGGGSAGGAGGGAVAPLTVTFVVNGTGGGKLTWTYGGASGVCPGQCSVTAPPGSELVVRPYQDEVSGFVGFGSGCGSDPLVCLVPFLGSSRTVAATFNVQAGSPRPRSVSTVSTTGSAPNTYLAPDADGGFFFGGDTSGTLTFGGVTHSNTAFLGTQKLTVRGNLDVLDVASAGDHVVVAGQCSSNATFTDAGPALPNGPCVVRYSTRGELELARGWAATGRVSRVAVRPTGEIALAGGVSGALNLGTGALTDRGGGDFFFAMLGQDGGTTMARRGGRSDPDAPGGVAFAPNGDAIFTAQIYGGPATFENITLTQANFQTASFAARYAPDGGFLSGKGISGQVLADDVLVDANGDVHFVGEYSNTVDFGGISRNAGAGLTSHGFVVKWNSSWVAQWVAEGYGPATRAAMASDGSIALLGSYYRYANWGGGYLLSDETSVSAISALLVRISPAGVPVWSKRLSSGGGLGIAISRDTLWLSGNGRVAVGAMTTSPVTYLVDYGW